MLLPFLCSLCLMWTKGAEASDPNLPFMDYLDNNHMVCLKWGFDEMRGEIVLKFIVNTTGWIGFGLSPTEDMTGADLVMGGVGSSETYFKDYYSASNTMPAVDRVQSYTLLSLTESQGQTIMTFSRSFHTCDDQDLQITAQPMNLIYAYGDTDDIDYHGAQAGVKELSLLNPQPQVAVAGGKYMSVTVQNVTIPPDDTYYYCKVMQLPPLDTKHHIYQFRPVIEHPDLVHHMVFYRCPPFVTGPSEGKCYKGNEDACLAVVAAWAVGGGVFTLPDNTGFPVGGGDNGGFYMLQIHYDNPNKESGRTDNSGMRLLYTDQLRQYDVGILTTGVSVTAHTYYDIPARANKFRTYGVCNTSLFSEIIDPVPDLHVFAVGMHTHLAGREVRIGHFRNGRQIDFLDLDPNYDFNLQQTVTLGRTKTIKKGDEIVVECGYSTSDRAGVTHMGLATMDEMCLAFLVFYPRIAISTCISLPNITTLNQFPDGSSNQEQIIAYEKAMKNLSHIEFVIGDDFDVHIYPNGQVRDMMPSPTFPCNATNAANHQRTSWIWSQASLLFVLALIALM